MDTRAELGKFLRSRRDRLGPDALGVRSSGHRRRVAGLRREELAPLAGIGVDYYTRLEQGRAGGSGGVTPQVIDGIADAMGFDAAEREYAHNLNRPPRPTLPDSAAVVRPAIRHLLESMAEIPGYVLGPMANLVAWNERAATLFGDFGALPPEHRHWSHLLFLEPSIERLLDQWMKHCRDNIAFLRLQASRHPGHKGLTGVIERMLVDSDLFRRLWDEHDVADTGHTDYLFHHPVAGDLTLQLWVMALPNEPGQALISYTADPDSPSATALHRLAHIPAFRGWNLAVGLNQVAG